MSVASRIKAVVWRQQFDPAWWGAFVNPFYIARRGLWRAISAEAQALGGRLLDVGCGTLPYRSLISVDTYTGMEIDTEATRDAGFADQFYNGIDFPFEDACFDSVLCNQVLEHVFVPERFLREINRVLTPGGILLLTVPFVWDEHEQPFDFARYSSFGLASLLADQGFEICVHRKIGADFSIMAQLVNAYLHKVMTPRFHLRNLACVVLMGPISLMGLFFGMLLPANEDLYLDQLVVARKIRRAGQISDRGADGNET